MEYLRDPEAIYRRSFEIVRAEADLGRFSPVEASLVVRMIHACGMVDIAEDIVVSPRAAESGVAALAAGAPILCDAEMVASGIIRARLPSDNPVLCTLRHPEVADRARVIGNTRSAAAVEFWGEQVGGAVVAIGNAPTALFHLMELIEAGAPKPAVIVGLPVGFVGAVESKAALAAQSFEVPFITLAGRRGGSAMAVAAINAMAILAGRTAQ